jgi:hypothetical protein
LTIAQVKQDLVDVLELDCTTLLLESDPGAIINLWISQSVATQNLILEVEAMLEGAGFSEMLKKGINSYTVENGLRDALENKLQETLMADPSSYDQTMALNKMTDLLKALPVTSTFNKKDNTIRTIEEILLDFETS